MPPSILLPGEYDRGVRDPTDAAAEWAAEVRRAARLRTFTERHQPVDPRSRLALSSLGLAFEADEWARRQRLLTGARAGDPRAVRELWRRYRCRVLMTEGGHP